MRQDAVRSRCRVHGNIYAYEPDPDYIICSHVCVATGGHNTKDPALSCA